MRTPSAPQHRAKLCPAMAAGSTNDLYSHAWFAPQSSAHAMFYSSNKTPPSPAMPPPPRTRALCAAVLLISTQSATLISCQHNITLQFMMCYALLQAARMTRTRRHGLRPSPLLLLLLTIWSGQCWRQLRGVRCCSRSHLARGQSTGHSVHPGVSGGVVYQWVLKNWRGRF